MMNLSLFSKCRGLSFVKTDSHTYHKIFDITVLDYTQPLSDSYLLWQSMHDIAETMIPSDTH